MISRLFQVYRASPFWLREAISRATWPLRVAMRPFRTIDMGSYSMVLDFDDNASFKYVADRGRYEHTEVQAFLRAIAHNPGCVVVDLGANYGAFTLAAGHLAELGLARRIVAVEPDRRPFEALRESVRRNGYDSFTTVHQVIAGDSPGRETIFVNARSSADNRSHRVTSSPIRVRDSYEVECVTIDELLARLGETGTAPLVVKMDIQGNEPRALRGMRGALEAAPGWVLLFEHAPYLIESAGIELGPYEDELIALGADEMVEIRGRELSPIAGPDALRTVFERLGTTTTTRMQGVGTNLVFAKTAKVAGPSSIQARD